MFNRSIGVVSPSFPRAAREPERFQRAIRNLEKAGYSITLGPNILLNTGYTSGTIHQRAADIHELFANDQVHAILAASGGWNANDLIDHLDYPHIAKHSKPFVGFSDITVLLYALQSRANVPVYYGPTLISNFAEARFLEYTTRYLESALNQEEYDITPAEKISKSNSLGLESDTQRNEGWTEVHGGEAAGILFGGNLGTLYLSCLTNDLSRFYNGDLILVIEDDAESHGAMNYRHLRALEQARLLTHVRAVLWGRDVAQTEYEPGYGPDWILKQFFSDEVPIYMNVDFGHTMPFATIPIGKQSHVSRNLLHVYNV